MFVQFCLVFLVVYFVSIEAFRPMGVSQLASSSLRLSGTGCSSSNCASTCNPSACTTSIPQHLKGINLLKNSRYNKGNSFSCKEKEAFELEGYYPNGKPQDMQTKVSLVMNQLKNKQTPLEKFIYLNTIQNVDENLFFSAVLSHLSEIMPIIYTPTVGEACQNWSHIVNPQSNGLYISHKNKGNIKKIFENYKKHHDLTSGSNDIKVIVLTDGERILGLGDLGINGMGIPIGKLALYTACAGIHPHQCLPITLDVGTNTKNYLEDPYYLGTRTTRPGTTGAASTDNGLPLEKPISINEYDDLIDELFTSAQETFGKEVLIQFEDFGNSNAFRLLDRYKEKSTCFNDDIQGTASVVLAGLISSLKLVGKKDLSEHKYLFYGAGEAGIGIADLIASAISKHTGLSHEEARKRCWFVDSNGLITQARNDGKLAHHKIPFAHDPSLLATPSSSVSTSTGKDSTLLDAIHRVQPTALIGVSAQGQAFTQKVIESMSKYSKTPLIFALSNPTSKAECTAEEAYKYTNGNVVFASGSPFPSYELNGKKYIPGQGNNAYIFPGVGLGVIEARAKQVTDEDFIVAAEALAAAVTDEQLATGTIYPKLSDIRDVSTKIAAKVAENIVNSGRTVDPSLKNKTIKQWEEHCENSMYKPGYKTCQ